MDKFIHTVDVALRHAGELFVITRPEGKHAGGMLAFPGGKVDYSDAQTDRDILIHAAKRELLEEIGYALEKPLQYVTSQSFSGNTEKHLMNTVFVADLDEKPTFHIPRDEASAFSWMTDEQILSASNCPSWLKGYIYLIYGTKKA